MSLLLTTASLCEAVWFKLLLYGNSGAGKTWRAVQARRPGDSRRVLALLTEANGVQSARHANPSVLLPSWPLVRRVKNAAGQIVDEPVLDVAGKPMVRHYATKMAEVREVFSAVQNREVPDLDVLVIDGLTEVQAMMKDEMQAMKDRAVQEGKAKREALVFSKQDWGELGEKMRRLMRNLRDLPVHVISTALAEVEVEDGEGDATIRYTVPSFQGKKLHNQAASYNNVVAYCYTANSRNSGGTRKVDRLAMVEGPETIQCKPAHPLGGVLEQPLWEWLDMLAKPPEDGAVLGRTLTDAERAALDAAQVEGQKQTADRRAKEQKDGGDEVDPDAPRVDLSAGQEPPKSDKPDTAATQQPGRLRRAGRPGR